jgi:hypothetical protein
MAYTGTTSLEDLRLKKHDAAVDWGFDKINVVLQEDLTQFNAMLTEYIGFMAEPLTEQGRVWGASGIINWSRADEDGKARTQDNSSGSEVMFPIWRYNAGLAFTNQFLMTASVAEIAERYIQANLGYVDQMIREMRRALFAKDNYATVDMFKGTTLNVKRLLNADSTPIPQYGGKSFTASSHTHYLARTSTLANADIEGVINHVREHGGKGIKVFINADNAAAITALSGFKALSSGLLVAGLDSTVAKNNSNDDPNDCHIGYFSVAGVLFEVWIKPAQLIPANYVMAVATSPDNEKALGFRQLVQPQMRGLHMMPALSNNVLRVDEMEGYYGFGANGRASAAILYIGNTSWADATIL